MYTREHFIEAVRKEGQIISHLHSKMTPDMLDFRPTPAQRSTRELLEYIPCCAFLIGKCLAEGGFQNWKPGADAIKAAVAKDFNAALNAEIDKLADWVKNLSDADLKKEVKTPPGDVITLAQALVDMNYRFLTAYKMQFFLYLKACGRNDLATVNCWAGRDPSPKK